jgi:hypothetical protein
MKTEFMKNDGGRQGGNGGVGIRKTISSSSSNSNILAEMQHSNGISKESSSSSCKSKYTALSSSSSSSSSSVIHVTGSRMIQRIFVSCTIFVIGTIHYGSVSIMKHDGRNMSTIRDVNYNNLMSDSLDMILNSHDTNKKTNMTSEKAIRSLPSTSTMSMEKSASSRTSIATFVRQEMERLKSSGTNPCSINSDVWLNSTRYGNINQSDDDTYLTHELVQHMILNLPNALQIPDQANDVDDNSVLPTILKQTICHEQSRFLQSHNSMSSLISSTPTDEVTSPTSSSSSGFDERTIRLWAVKLIYLSIHYHQHRLAVPEAVIRYNSYNNDISSPITRDQCPTSPQHLKELYNVGIFDYECPDAKYIVMPLGGNGLGSNVRGGMVVGLLIGLITDRIVLFVNDVKGASYYMDKPWSLASCPRKDYQCFFWPTSPCTVTHEEIKKAYALTRDDYRKVIKGNDQLKHIEEHKVWAFNTPFLPVVTLPKHAADTLYQHAITLIAAVSKEQYPTYHSLLMEAAATIRIPDDARPGYNYAAANTKVQHALAFYAMRPNPRNAHELDLILNHIIPKTFPPETSIGLPIRGTSFNDVMKPRLQVSTLY